MSAQVQERVAIQLLGPLTAVVGGRRLTGRTLGSRKARTVLGLLATHGQLTADRLVEAAWPDRLPGRPAAELAILVSRLRSVLGTATISGGRGGYRIDRGLVSIDLEEAERLVDEAEARSGEPALAVAAATGALALLDRGEIAEDEPEAEWVDRLRGRVGAARRRARLALATGALGTADPAAARRAAEAALLDDPLDEEACRLLMRSASGLGEDAVALAAYEQLRLALAETVGADPSAATRNLHLAVLRGAEIAESGGSTPAASRRSPLVGRDDELALLAGTWQRTLTSGCTLLLVTGEAGIGKTALSEQVRALAAGALVLSGRCWQAERSLFLQPLVEAIGAAVAGLSGAVLADVVVTQAEVLAALVPEVAAVRPAGRAPVTVAPDAGRRAAYDAIAGFLRRLSRHQPLVLIVDDLHNAGLATVDLLHYLVRSLPDSPLLVVATVRTDEGAEAIERLSPIAEQLVLAPLDDQAVTSLVSAAGQGDHLAEILASTSGHPLFVVETLRGLAGGEPGIPRSLQDSVLRQVARQGRDGETLLRAAAVLGSTFDPADLAAITGEPAARVNRACEDALRARLLAESGRSYSFSYDLVREVLYRTTPDPSRIGYHLLAADRTTQRPEALAGHAAAAGDPVRAAKAWLLAGEQALRRFAAADAGQLLDRAIAALAGHGADVEVDLAARCHLVRGRTREAQMQWTEAIADYRLAGELARDCGDLRLEMTALWELGCDSLAAAGSPLAVSTDHLERASALARRLGDRAFEATVLSRLAVLASNDLDFRTAHRLASRATDLGRASGDASALTAGLDGLKTVHAYLGEIGELQPVLDELLPLARRQQDVLRLQWSIFESGFPALGRGDWTTASARVEEALSYSRSRGSAAYEAWFLAHLGWFARLQGRGEDALAHGLRAMDAGRRAEPAHAWCRAMAAVCYATTLLRAGRRDEAAAVLLAAQDTVASGQARAYRARFCAATAEATGDPEALAEAAELLSAVTTPDGSAWLLGWDAYASLARAQARAGDREGAQATVRPLMTAAARIGWEPVLREVPDLVVDGYSISASMSAALAAPSVSTGR